MVPFFASPRRVVKIHTVQWTLGKIWWKSRFFFGISMSVQSFWPRARIISQVISTIFCKIHLVSINPTIQRLPLIPIYWYCTCKIERQNLGSYFKNSHPRHENFIQILDPSKMIVLWPKDIPISNLALTFDQNLLVMTAAVPHSGVCCKCWEVQSFFCGQNPRVVGFLGDYTTYTIIYSPVI